MKPKHFPLIPIMATGIFWEGNERNMEEIGGLTQSWENLQERARLSAIFWAFPREKIILWVLEMPGTPQKQKWAAATITKQTQKLAKQIKPATTKYFPFPTHSH